jgi:hypothetical protein
MYRRPGQHQLPRYQRQDCADHTRGVRFQEDQAHHDGDRRQNAHLQPEDALLISGLRLVHLRAVQVPGSNAARLSVAVSVHPNLALDPNDVSNALFLQSVSARRAPSTTHTRMHVL